MTNTNDKLEEQRRDNYNTAKAFENVFGEDGHRNADQLKVWNALQAICSYDRTCLRFANGELDMGQSIANEGARMVLLKIREQLLVAKAGLDPITKVTVNKT